MTHKLTRIRWDPSYRLVSSRFPPVGLFDRVADPADLEVVLAVESLTNDRLRDEAGEIRLVPPAERVSGPGTTPIMAAFTHLNPSGSRFSDGTFGVYYAAREIETSIAEQAHHRAIFLAATREAPGEIDLRCYLAKIDARLVDVRGWGRRKPDIMNLDDYSESQRFGAARRGEGAAGIAYDSVRRPGGQCVAMFRPKSVGAAIQGSHICLVWDGRAVTGWYEKSGMKPL
jgi:hypothetical protein